MKKAISLILSAVMLISITVGLNITAYAEVKSGACGDGVTYTYDTATGALTILGAGDMSNCDEYAPWHEYASSIKTVTISKGITSIYSLAFAHCSSLTSIAVDSGNTVYDSRNNCNAIVDTAINTLVAGCKGTVIPNTVKCIGYGAFFDCDGLSGITIPSSVTSIDDCAFSDCDGLTSIEIPSSVTSIGDDVLLSCDGLTSVIVGSGNTVYDSRNNCNAIIETATNTLVAGCKSTVIPNTVTSIGYCAFSDCGGLTNITIPSGVTSIGYGAFSGCDGLTSITIPYGVTSIGDSTFYDCRGIISVTIQNGVTSIGGSAFSGCTELKSISIPKSVAEIGQWAFDNCRSLTSITVENGNPVYNSKDNCNAIIETSTNTLVKGCVNTVIPNGVTSIGNSAFYGCGGLTSMAIPNSVTVIDDCAFSGCSGLTSITIPSGVTSIGISAFNGCNSLTDVYYGGSEAQWKQIKIGTDNQILNGVTIHFAKASASTTAVKKPKATSIKKLSKGKKSFKVTWKKVSGVTGYQVKYSTSKKYTKKTTKTTTIKGSKKTSKTVKKLKAKKKYYVKVRTYKTVKVNGKSKKVYSKWSKTKTVKTK